MNDPYCVLGVERTASKADITAAFRVLAAKHHPDKNPENTAAQVRFREVCDAYTILGDEKKRRDYDRATVPVINTVADLLFHHPYGKRALANLLTTAPATPQRGADIVIIHRVSLERLRAGGNDVVNAQRSNGTQTRLPIVIPPNAETTNWCRIPAQGEPGKNGAEPGDVLIVFIPDIDKSYQGEHS